MANCKKCGGPLKKGNIKVIRPRGKKRPYRVCRVCPPKKLDFNIHCPGIIPPVKPVIQEVFLPAKTVDTSRMLTFPQRDRPVIRETTGTAGNPRQKPQDTTGGRPAVVEVYREVTGPDPARFRFFMTQEQAERVLAAAEKNVAFGMGVSFEAIPVPAFQVDQEPERFDDLVEMTVNWKGAE
jgi:hypothetical protein